MLKIGDFSKLSRISIRMLRHYDELGLLIPETVDEYTGYRYYNETQLLIAGRIQVLKNMGFSLSVIREIINKFSDSGELEQFLVIKKKELEEQDQEIRQKILLLDSTIRWLRKDGNIMGYDVCLKTIPERYAASVRQVLPSYQAEGILWQLLMEETAGMHLQQSSPAYNLAIFHDGEYKDNNVDVEIQKSVTGTYRDTKHVTFKTIPATQIASVTFKGSYEQIAHVNTALAKWISDNGYDYNGLAFNIYHVSRMDAQNMEDCVTEVCYPVKKK